MTPRRDGLSYTVAIEHRTTQHSRLSSLPDAPEFASIRAAFDWLQARHIEPLVFFASAGDAGSDYAVYFAEDFTGQPGFPLSYTQPTMRYNIRDHRFDEQGGQFIYRGRVRYTRPGAEFRDVREYAWYMVNRMNDVPENDFDRLRDGYPESSVK